MKQYLHLLVVDVSGHHVLASGTGGRWILPVVCLQETSRVGSVIGDWLAHRSATGSLIGQWLGRVARTRDALDWLVVVRIDPGSGFGGSSEPNWINFATLANHRGLFDFQDWAVALVLRTNGVPCVPGPFGSLTWPDRVMAWASEAAGLDLSAAGLRRVWHRSGPYEVVVEWDTPHGRWFFKGLAHDRASEATITRRMAAILPEYFARTVAWQIQPDASAWWLMEGCLGDTLARDLSINNVRQTVRAYAAVQQSLTEVVDRTAEQVMPPIDLSLLGRWALEMLSSDDPSIADTRSLRLIANACDEIGAAGLPASWIATDLDPTNVLVTGEDVRFIDLDEAMLGPAPLGVAILASRLATSQGSNHWDRAAIADLLRAYDGCWSPPLNLTRRWGSIGLVSRVLECHLAWRRVQTKSHRGEVFDILEIARTSIRQRLQRAVAIARRGP